MADAYLDDHAHEHDKLLAIGGAAAWYWACGLMYCRRNEERRRKKSLRVDVIPKSAALGLYPDPLAAEHVQAFLRVKLWEELDAEHYVVHDYHEVYGRHARQPDQQDAPAARQQSQQRQLTPSQLAARRLGGQARAAAASRAAGRYQQTHQQPLLAADQQPTSKNPRSGSGSLQDLSGSASPGIGSKEASQPAKELSGNQQPAAEPAKTGGQASWSERSIERKREPGQPPRPRHDPLFERMRVTEWAPSADMLAWARERGLPDAKCDDAFIELRTKMQASGAGLGDVSFWDLKAVAFLETAIARHQRPPGLREHLSRGGKGDPQDQTHGLAADELARIANIGRAAK